MARFGCELDDPVQLLAGGVVENGLNTLPRQRVEPVRCKQHGSNGPLVKPNALLVDLADFVPGDC